MDHRGNGGGGGGAGELGMPSSSLSYSFSKRDDLAAETFVHQHLPPTRAGNGSSNVPDRAPDPRFAGATQDTGASSNYSRPVASVRYRECLRNHAASVGGLVVDGCGEFMPAEGEIDALKCAVCGCHRSFHRKEIDGMSAAAVGSQPRSSVPPYYYHPYQLNGASGRRSCSTLATRIMQKQQQQQPPPLLALPPPSAAPLKPSPIMAFAARGCDNESSEGGGGTTTDSSSEELEAHTPVTPTPTWPNAAAEQARLLPHVSPSASSRKRFRTKFTAEQRERMLVFAETLGWRMQRRDEGTVERFCSEVGVPRNVFKVWMHNNKHISASTRSELSHQLHQHQQDPSQHQKLQPQSSP